jgi:hypothetical protein
MPQRKSFKPYRKQIRVIQKGFGGRQWKRVGWGSFIPEQYGGAGNSLTSAGVLFEALGTGPLFKNLLLEEA